MVHILVDLLRTFILKKETSNPKPKHYYHYVWEYVHHTLFALLSSATVLLLRAPCSFILIIINKIK